MTLIKISQTAAAGNDRQEGKQGNCQADADEPL